MIRILTGVLLASGAWLLIFNAPQALLAAGMTVAAFFALRELFDMVDSSGVQPLSALGYAGVALWILVPSLDGGFVFVLLTIVLLSAAVLGGRAITQVLPSTGITLLCVIYVGGPALFALTLHAMSPHWLAFPILVTALGDSAALVIGKLLGRHKLAPRLSPKKTWEGTVASAVVSIVSGAIYAQIFLVGDATIVEAVVLALVLNALAQVGDLVESTIKRAAGRKDSGAILPGHGGVLDRVDGLLFAVPALYAYLEHLR